MTITAEFGEEWKKKSNPDFIYLIHSQGRISVITDSAGLFSIKLILASCNGKQKIKIDISDKEYYSGYIRTDCFVKVQFDLILNLGQSEIIFLIQKDNSEEFLKNDSSHGGYKLAIKDFIITKYEITRVL